MKLHMHSKSWEMLYNITHCAYYMDYMDISRTLCMRRSGLRNLRSQFDFLQASQEARPSMAVLEADRLPGEHPLALAVREARDLVEELCELRGWRNWVSHGQIGPRGRPEMPEAAARQARIVGVIGELMDACREAIATERSEWQVQL